MSRQDSLPCSGFLSPHALARMPKDTPVLLAFSGGADSCALLELLARKAQTDGFLLLAAHVDHGIRKDEARRDREFCMRVARRYGVELCVKEVDVPALAAQSGMGLEEQARAVRYAYFEELMRARSIPLLATAHHADDHLERFCSASRGAVACAGLAALPPCAILQTVSWCVLCCAAPSKKFWIFATRAAWILLPTAPMPTPITRATASAPSFLPFCKACLRALPRGRCR